MSTEFPSSADLAKIQKIRNQFLELPDGKKTEFNSGPSNESSESSDQVSQNVENVNENINHNSEQILEVSQIELPTTANRVNTDSNHGYNIEKEKLIKDELLKRLRADLPKIQKIRDLFLELPDGKKK